MVNMLDELKERNILKMILIVRFACATLDLGHPIDQYPECSQIAAEGRALAAHYLRREIFRRPAECASAICDLFCESEVYELNVALRQEY
jgi:hypothetical protein